MRLTPVGKVVAFFILLIGVWVFFIKPNTKPQAAIPSTVTSAPIQENAQTQETPITVTNLQGADFVVESDGASDAPTTGLTNAKEIVVHRTGPVSTEPVQGDTTACLFEIGGECFTEDDLFQAFLYGVDYSLARDIFSAIIAHPMHGTLSEDGFYVTVRGQEYSIKEHATGGGSYTYMWQGNTRGTLITGNLDSDIRYHEALHAAQWAKADTLTNSRNFLYHLSFWIDSRAAGEYQVLNEMLPNWEYCRYQYSNGMDPAPICTEWEHYSSGSDVFSRLMPAHNTNMGASWKAHVLDYYRSHGLTE